MANERFIHLLPMSVPEDFEGTAAQFSLLPWVAPAHLGVVGRTLGKDGSPALMIAYEWPMQWLRTVDPFPKYDIERLHIRRYSADQALVVGHHAWTHVQRGSDPPDATVDTDEGRVGVEAAALTVPGRREVYGLFSQLRQRLQTTEPAHFINLRAHVVYVWFEEPGRLAGKPFRRNDKEALDELVAALAAYVPDQGDVSVGAEPLPDALDGLPGQSTTAGARFYAVPLAGAVPNSMLFTLAGFDIGLGYTTLLTAKDAWAEVQRLVDSHDKPGVDVLLLTAGGPNVNGSVFPVEDAMAEFVTRHPLGLTRPPDHIKRIFLHRWLTGQAACIHPEVAPMFGPLYAGLAPAHQPIVVLDGPEQEVKPTAPAADSTT